MLRNSGASSAWPTWAMVAAPLLLGALTVFGAACTCDCGTGSAVCGDGLCSGAEDAFGCVEDCGCGDGFCDPIEQASCPADCAATCGDGVCDDPAENPYRCPADCVPACLSGPCWLPGEQSCDECIIWGAGSMTLELGPFDYTTAELEGAFGHTEAALQAALAAAGEAGTYDFSGFGTVWAAREVMVPQPGGTISAISPDGSRDFVLVCSGSPLQASDNGSAPASVYHVTGCFGACSGDLVSCFVGASPLAGANPDPYGTVVLQLN